MNTPNPFPVLTTVSQLLHIIGLLTAVAGVLYAVFAGVFEPMMPKHSFSFEDLFDFVVGAAAAVIGIVVVAFAEIIGVAFAIEANTRRTADAATSQQLKNNM